MKTEESEKLTPSLRDWRGRSLALLTQLTAWSAQAPLIHRQGGMNIYKKLRNSVARLPRSFSFLLSYIATPVVLLCLHKHHLVVADSLWDARFYIYLSLFISLMWEGYFPGITKSSRLFIAGADTITGFIAKTRCFVIMHNFVVLCILAKFLFTTSYKNVSNKIGYVKIFNFFKAIL